MIDEVSVNITFASDPLSVPLTGGGAAVIPVILCGGAGTRLWPASRADRPKQFLDLFDSGRSLFQDTLARMASLGIDAPARVVCAADQADLVRMQAGDGPVAIITEPCARNTAPAIALAALSLPADAVMLVCPSDHRIDDVAALSAALDVAVAAATDGWLVTFGIRPDRAETGYGYIARGEALAKGVFRAEAFIEKPARAVAARLFADGLHDWNAGLFVMRADRLIEAMDRHCPDIIDTVRAACGPEGTIDAERFAAVRPLSIDHAVMEQAERVAVVPVAMGWSDVGGWQTVHALSPQDTAGNAAPGNAFVIDTRSCLVRSDGSRVTLLGVDGLAVIVDGDDIAIFPLDRAQDVRMLAAAQPGSKSNGDAPRS